MAHWVSIKPQRKCGVEKILLEVQFSENMQDPLLNYVDTVIDVDIFYNPNLILTLSQPSHQVITFCLSPVPS